MADGTFRDEWVSEVFRNPGITDATRVMLLALARDMDEDGLVEVSRADLAARLSRHARKVTERYNAAQAAGFLEKASGGNRGGSNVFQATFPDHGKGADGRHPEDELPYKDHAGAHSNADRSDANADVTVRGDEAVVIPLFDEEIKIPPPAGASAPEPEPRPITAQTVLGAWIAAVQEVTGERPTPRMIGNISGQAKALLADKRDPIRLVAAATSLGRKIGRGYLDLGQEYLMAASSGSAASTGTEGLNGIQGYGPRADTSNPTNRKIII